MAIMSIGTMRQFRPCACRSAMATGTIKGMRAHPEVKLSGRHNECPTCGELFASNFAFSEHRVGKIGVLRRCLVPGDLLARGWAKTGHFWRTPAREDVRA